ncbi:hypothetical protein O6H91_11G028600 [Diphasiastrum complanatum]|uniref:Uncharacterized protein n=1 Tax=Diphasiastrum complanatum TaxID=34168 RepID=A0ACC2C7H4_DIPCM|nr:hypothetical protein O6H91_11G028600 [Diphasiastrum complanatum]
MDMAPAAGDAGLFELELIMDGNLQHVLARTSVPPPPPSALPLHKTSESTSDSEVSVTVEAEEPGLSLKEEAASPAHRFSGAASISLSLGSLLSSNLLLSKAGIVTPNALGSSKAPSKVTLKAPSAVPSQKKVHTPMPVVPSSEVKFSVDASKPHAGAGKVSNFVSAFPDYQMLPKSGRSFKEPGNGAGLRRASVMWFRNDLRIHDNEALASANKESLSVLPIYCFDPRDYGKSSSGFDKTGPYRAKFLLECVANLRANLRERGSDLIVRVGNPEEVVAKIAKAVGADALYAHQEVSSEELHLEEKVAMSLKDEGVESKYFWGSTLYHIDDLPFKLEDMPSNYGGFREKVQNVQVRPTAEAPANLKALPARGDVKPGDIPTLQELGLNPAVALRQESSTGGRSLVGGEAEALRRLKTFALEIPVEQRQKDGNPPSHSLYGANFSCKISPWLAMGCLSPRRMFEDLKRNGSRMIAVSAVKGSGSAHEDGGLNWLVFELLWRDFFRFITKKYGSCRKDQVATSPVQSYAGSGC